MANSIFGNKVKVKSIPKNENYFSFLQMPLEQLKSYHDME